MTRHKLMVCGVAILLLAAAVVATISIAPVAQRQESQVTAAGSQEGSFDLACSPPPQCFRDRDCDSICGKRNGTCRRVNSCYNECVCNQTFQASGM